jgi:hypothetical protein
MKRLVWTVSVVALTVVASLTTSRRFAAGSQAHNGGGEVSPEDVTLSSTTRGVVFATAAINPDGTVANCFTCNKSLTGIAEGPGTYQVFFNQNVQANNGWSRWVQVDTLSTGSIANVSCTTADRAGHANAVWVACFNNQTGVETPTSFFLFVAR